MVFFLVFQIYVICCIGFIVICVDLLYYCLDLLFNVSIFVVLFLVCYGWLQSDGLFGLGIVLYIFWSVLQIVCELVLILMDWELFIDISECMCEFVCSVLGVFGVYDVCMWIFGNYWFVQLYFELFGELSLLVVYVLIDCVVLVIKCEYLKVEVLIYVDLQEVVGKEIVS